MAMDPPEQREETKTVLGPQTTRTLPVRAARQEDAEAVATILAESFPALYRSTFGNLGVEETAWLLTELYRAGHLSLEATRVCERGGRVVGIAILHLGEAIGRGSALGFVRLLLRQLGLWRALRAFFGGLSTNLYLSRRIPHGPDLVYIEALAVLEAERGRGVGTRLLADAEEWTRARGRSRLALHVLLTNKGARRLYERHGFRPWRDPAAVQGLFSRPRTPWTALLLSRSVEEETAEKAS